MVESRDNNGDKVFGKVIAKFPLIYSPFYLFDKMLQAVSNCASYGLHVFSIFLSVCVCMYTVYVYDNDNHFLAPTGDQTVDG